jgi:uncharacterized protein (DUF2236 family)
MVADTLVHTAAVDDVLSALARPSAPSLPVLQAAAWPLARLPLGHVLQLATIGLLPQPLRGRFGVPWSPAQELQLRALGAALRASTPVMPSWLQNTGAGYLRYRAQAIARGEVASPDRLATPAV